MKLNRDDETKIKSYLLGEMAQEGAQELEERLLREDGFTEQVLLVEDELIEDFERGALSPDERERFQKHFLRTPKRRRKLMMIQGMRRHASGLAESTAAPRAAKSWVSSFFLPRWKIAVAAVILLAFGFGVWRAFIYRSQVDKGLIALKDAYRDQRPLEARLTVLSYAPYQETRGVGQAQVNARARDLSAALLLNAVSDDPNPTTLHALGCYYMTQREFDKAVLQFEEGLKISPNDAQLHADLGAALLEQAKALRARNEGGQSLEKLATSLEHLNRALELNPARIEALFNKALCLQNMMLPEQARQAWGEYLKHDSTSPWAEEARRNLQSSTESKAMNDPEQVLKAYLDACTAGDDERAWQVLRQTREMITRRMVPWQLARDFLAEKIAGRDEKAAQLLQCLNYAGALEQQRASDSYVSDIAHYYTLASREQMQSLSQAQAELKAGYEHCLISKYEMATDRFKRAQQLFVSAGDTCEAQLAEYWIAYCLSQSEQLRASNALLDSIANYSREHGYKWLLSLAIGWIANNHGLLGEYSKAIQYDRQALELAEAVSDTYHIQKLYTHLGIQYSYLGRNEQALAHFYRSLALAAASPPVPRQSWRNFAFAAETLYATKKYQASAAYEREALRLGLDELKDPTLIHRSYLHLAAIYADLGQYQEAANYAGQSMQVAQSVGDDSAAARLIANSHRQLAYVERQSGNIEEALEHYNQAIELAEGKDNVLRKYETHKGRLLCYMAQNDSVAVQNELSLVIALFEGNRTKILEEQNRNSFFDNEQSIYDLAIDYEYTRGNYRQAYEYSEASRARSLLDALQGDAKFLDTGGDPGLVFSSVSSPLTLAEIQARLPQAIQVIQYSVLKDKVLVWLISNKQFEVHERNVPREQLEASVSRYLQQLPGKDEALREAAHRESAKLYAQLIGPVAAGLDKSREVCVIPDKVLFQLPFAALVSPDNGAYLIEDFPLLYAPSVSSLILCSDAAQTRSQSTEEFLLSVGNPTFDRETYADLQDLPLAAKEAREITRLYRNSVTFIGADATKDSVKREMGRADVLHFACHYLVDETSPMRSKLLLAAAHTGSVENGNGTMASYEVLEQHLRRPRLVVLSACQTGIERLYGGEGMIGLARTFIAAGVPLVIASQWLVDSDATAELMIKFHAYRKQQKLPTVAALRRAQLDLLSEPGGRYQQPFYWAAFLAVGGDALF